MIVSVAVAVLICEPAGVALASLNPTVLLGAFAVLLSMMVTGKVFVVSPGAKFRVPPVNEKSAPVAVPPLCEYAIDAAALVLPERATVTLKVPLFSVTEYVVALNLKATFFGAAEAPAGKMARTMSALSSARTRGG